VSQLLLRLLTKDSCRPSKNAIFGRREVLSFVVDVLTETYTVFRKKHFQYAELYNDYLTLKTDTTNCLQELLLGRITPQGVAVWREDLVKKTITALFQQFVNTECLTTLGVTWSLIAAL
jgi:hypothetical protein